MKASEVAAALMALAAKHNDPHVYAIGNGSPYLLAVEPFGIAYKEIPIFGSAVFIVGGQWRADGKRLWS